MDDLQIIEGLFARREEALAALLSRYGAWLRTVARRILGSAEDAEECVSDAAYRVWNAIPPARPQNLRAYLTAIVRRRALDLYRGSHAAKRAGVALLLDELAECVAAPEAELEEGAVTAVLNRFLRGESEERRYMFLHRYYACEGIREIARQLGVSESKVKSALYAMRHSLRRELEKEGIAL